MSLAVLGVNYTTADVSVREMLAIGDSRIHDALRHIANLPDIAEAGLLSTCNRTEIYVSGGSGDFEEALTDFLAGWHRLPRHKFAKRLYHYRDAAAAAHLFSVAAGLDSMILGEPDIQRQVKRALETTQTAGTAGPVLNKLFRDALVVGKQVRTRTGIARGSLSVGAVAVERVTQIFGDSLAGCTVLIRGAGKMSELTAKHLQSRGVSTVIVANRTYEKAVQIARKFHGTAQRYDELPQALRAADIVVCSTSAPHPVLTRAMVKDAMRARHNRELFLVDIAVPRDVEPSAGDLENVYLYNIDDLVHLVAGARQSRTNEIEHASALIDQSVVEFMRWRHSLEAAPLIVAVRDRLADIRNGELARLRARMPGLTEKEWRSVEAAMEALTNKVAHGAIRTIKQTAHAGCDSAAAETIRRAFGFSEPVHPPVERV